MAPRCPVGWLVQALFSQEIVVTNVTTIFRDDATLRQITESVLINKVEERPGSERLFFVYYYTKHAFFQIFICVQLTRSQTKLVLNFCSSMLKVEISLSFFISFVKIQFRFSVGHFVIRSGYKKCQNYVLYNQGADITHRREPGGQEIGENFRCNGRDCRSPRLGFCSRL